MPAMANIVVKKNDGTTDITYDQLAPSAGDGVPAVWRQDTGNGAVPNGMRPQLKLTTNWNGPRTARTARFDYAYPHTFVNSTTGQSESKDKVVFNGTVILPQGVTQATLDEASSQLSNLLGSALIKLALKSGYSPT